MLRQLASWSSLSLVSTFHPLSILSPNWYFWSKTTVLLPTPQSVHMVLNELQWSPHSSVWISGTPEYLPAFIHKSTRLSIARVCLPHPITKPDSPLPLRLCPFLHLGHAGSTNPSLSRNSGPGSPLKFRPIIPWLHICVTGHSRECGFVCSRGSLVHLIWC